MGTPFATVGKRPSHILSITLRFSAWFSSWCTIATPFSSASLEFLKFISLPSKYMFPESLLYTPKRHFISVDLPAPFSPISACTVPAFTVRFTLSSALTPGKAFSMFSILSRTGFSLTVVLFVTFLCSFISLSPPFFCSQQPVIPAAVKVIYYSPV